MQNLKSLIFFTFTIIIILSTSQATNLDAVLDTAGRKLVAGQEYHIMPLVRGIGGGTTLKARPNITCPLYVASENYDTQFGLPVTFSPASPKDKFIRLKTDLNFEFSAATTCSQSTVWTLKAFYNIVIRFYVGTGGVKGNPGSETIRNWFSIDKYDADSDHYYKIVYCPTVCETCAHQCEDVGLNVENGTRWLGLFGDAWPVVFTRVPLDEKISSD